MTHFLYTNRITFEYEVWCIEYMSHLDTNYNNLININNCNVLYFSATKEMINCPVGTYNPNLNGQSVADCVPCDPGYYCLEGVSTPNGPCEAGFYCPSPIVNPYGSVPANIGSYGPRMVC